MEPSVPSHSTQNHHNMMICRMPMTFSSCFSFEMTQNSDIGILKITKFSNIIVIIIFCKTAKFWTKVLQFVTITLALCIHFTTICKWFPLLQEGRRCQTKIITGRQNYFYAARNYFFPIATFLHFGSWEATTAPLPHTSCPLSYTWNIYVHNKIMR